MLVLKLAREPEWVELIAHVRVRVSPLTSAVMMAVRADLADAEIDTEDQVAMHVALVKGIARRTITEWEGVGDADGAILQVTPEAIAALMDYHRCFEVFEAKVVSPYLLVQAEKKASAPSPDGTSAKGGTTAKTATPSAKSARED